MKIDPKAFEAEIKKLGLEDIAAECNIELTSATTSWLDKFLTKDPQMIEEKLRAKKLAKSDIPVLVIGETGTGKELIANALHGERRGKFVAVNCGGIPDTLLEAEFFGNVKGAFTGAYSDRHGYFEEAKGGTIFLDEIGELPKMLQCKLLRVLQSKKLRRIGGATEIPISCRIVAATNKTVAWLNDEANFRQDLFYRLAGNIIHLKPLRDRPGDIQLICEANGVNFERFKPYLYDKWWPGNVRELLNIIEGHIKIFHEL